MDKKRYLTKSRFKLANECPTKLFYTGKSEYANQKLDDSFLLALADGGFQVSALAKCYFPGGYDIETQDEREALAETKKLLELDKVIIYEAAIATDKLFIRADILVKNGNQLNLYEVKSKSFDPGKKDPFANKNGTIKSTWKPYLYDVAFQKFVITRVFPQYEVLAHLMMADKTALCPTDGLNQKFYIVKNPNGQKSVSMSQNLTEEDLTPQILCKINVDEICNQIYNDTDDGIDQSSTFEQKISFYADQYCNDKKIRSQISTKCSGCEFYTTDVDEQIGLKSGKKECWKDVLGWVDSDFKEKTVLDVWNFIKKTDLIMEGRIKMSDITEEDICPKPDKKAGISASERRWLQVKKYKTGDSTIWLDYDCLKKVIDGLTYPLHFIDFETTMAAIPFNAGRRPYEGIAFQFSHHIVLKDGTIEHFGEYINTERGTFPNYDFLRELKTQLENDSGNIFRYSNHENTFLNMVYSQLQSDDSVTDRVELCDFIRTITKSKKDSLDQWIGERNMLDMCEFVKRYYYDPSTNGSNSIKQVLPAILNSSKYLQDKYSKPIYGSSNGIKSLNFKDWQWIKFDSGKVINPYKLLPKMFQDVTDSDMNILSDAEDLRDGGAALTAYARMQFEEMSDYEFKELRTAFLKYCELDTMAMVMIFEEWRELLR